MIPDETASSTYCLVAASYACAGSFKLLIQLLFRTILPVGSIKILPPVIVKLPDAFTVAVLTLAPLTLPVALTSPAVLILPPVTFPAAVINPPVIKLPPVTLAEAETTPPVNTLPPVTLPDTLATPVV